MTVRQLSADEVARLRELDAKTKEGPWAVDGMGILVYLPHGKSLHMPVCYLDNDEDADFIAGARNALPTLLAAYEERGAVIEELVERLTHGIHCEVGHAAGATCTCGLAKLKDSALRAIGK